MTVISKRKKTSTEREQSLLKLQRSSERWGRRVSIYTHVHTHTHTLAYTPHTYTQANTHMLTHSLPPTHTYTYSHTQHTHAIPVFRLKA